MFGKIIFAVLSICCLSLVAFSLVFIASPTNIFAQDEVEESTNEPPKFTGANDCITVDTEISIDDIFSPGSFTPIVPNDCALENGKARALSFTLIPVILVRAYGFIASMVMYLFTFMLVFSGVQYMWGGVDGNSDKKALRNIQDSVVAILLVVGSYIIVFTILTLLRIQNLDTDLTRFFE